MNKQQVKARVVAELDGMRDAGMIDQRTHAAAVRYVESNGEAVSEFCHGGTISDAADTVLDLVGSCSSGSCE